MPEVKGVVLLTLNAFNRLNQVPVNPAQVTSTFTQTADPVQEFLSQDPVIPPSRVDVPISQPSVAPTSHPQNMTEAAGTHESIVVNHVNNPLQSIPPNYRKIAEQMRELLLSLDDIRIEGDTTFYKGTDLGVKTDQLFRQLCVPLTKVTLPEEFLEAIRSHGISVRNHLARRPDSRPQWHAFFSF